MADNFHEEVAGRFGLLPNFFCSAQAAPGLIEELWGFAKSAYLDSPLPSLFKERLFVHLSRFCQARYCIVRHVGFLIGHGRPAGDADASPETIDEVVELLRRPLTTTAMIVDVFERLSAGPPLDDFPAPRSQSEGDLFDALTIIFVEPTRSEGACDAVRLALGDTRFEILIAYLAFIRTAHYWTETHPEIGYEPDMLLVMEQRADLAELLLDPSDAEKVSGGRKLRTVLEELRQTEATLRESDERLRAFTFATNNAIYVMSSDWSLMYQLEGSTFLANTDSADPNWLSKYIHPLDQGQFQEAVRMAVDNKTVFELEHRVLRTDGSVGWAFSRAIPILDNNGKIKNWFGAARDITDRKAIEVALLQREKLAAVGRLASTIAHEINNPLEAVTNLLFLARQHASRADVKDWLEQADQELRRVSAITSQTLRFHRQSTNAQAVTCSSLFGVTLGLYEKRLQQSGIAVEKRKRAQSPVLCFEGDIRQVLSNLVTNAIDAMPQGGRLLVRSREGTDWSSERKGIVLTVADSGIGMSAETSRHALDAFYTTKDDRGSGLGLWISQQVMERHRGKLSLRSSKHAKFHGTAVCLFIPFESPLLPGGLTNSE